MKEDRSIVSIDELITTFTGIDKRIGELHSHSTDVFSTLNKYLKDYYRKIDIISRNAAKIFSSIAGSDDKNLLDELKNLNKEFLEYLQKIKQENQTTSYHLNEINDLNNQLFFTIRNLKQDFITFKFLISNYRLITNYKNVSPVVKEAVEGLDKIIGIIHPWLNESGKELQKLSGIIRELTTKIQLYQDITCKSFNSLSHELGNTHELVRGKIQESESALSVLREKSSSSSRSIGNIITHLQYHDIIRQKIDHIQKSHSDIIKNLKGESEPLTGNNSPTDDHGHYDHIADISGLQAAQLMMISKEFQNALKVITSNFKNITDDVADITSLSNELSFESANSEITLLEKVRRQLDESILLLDRQNISSINEQLLHLHDSVRYVYKLLKHSVILPLERIRSSEYINLIADDNQTGTNIIRQIAVLVSEILEKNSEIKFRFKSILSESSKLLVNRKFDMQGSRLEQNQIRLMVRISKTLDLLDTENKELDDILDQNTALNQEILHRIDNIINRFEYHELFEQVLVSIIEKLNSVNFKLKPDGDVDLEEEKLEHLKANLALYTMASEREVHQKVISGYVEPDGPDGNDDDSDDVELF
ncbi:MAG TPA: hypothetical protein VE870_17465 [Bacteroidales bacterium]|nr:hypothetical protein [Bacteroidales bacterium]